MLNVYKGGTQMTSLNSLKLVQYNNTVKYYCKVLLRQAQPGKHALAVAQNNENQNKHKQLSASRKEQIKLLYERRETNGFYKAFQP